MRVLMLAWEYPPRSVGGIASHVDDLTRVMSDQGIHITLLTCGDSDLNQFEEKKNIHIYRVIPYSIHTYNITQWTYNLNCAMMEKCVEIIEKEGPFDLVHAHDWMVGFTARFAKTVYHIPLVSTIHATEFGRNNGLHNDMQRYISDIEWWLTYESWKVICCSHYMENQLSSFFQLPEDKIQIIYNGVQVDKFAADKVEEELKSQYAALNEKIVFFIGRHVHEKGLHVLIDAIPYVLRKYNDVKFIIAGRGPDTDYLKQRAVELGIHPRIYFTGYVDDEMRNKLYRIADVTVFPSLYEPFGIVALEGMAAKVPVVVSDTGGLREIVSNGIDGYKFEPGNPRDLAERINILLEDEEKCKKFAMNGYNKVLREFNWSAISSQTIQVYHTVVRDFKSFKPK